MHFGSTLPPITDRIKLTKLKWIKNNLMQLSYAYLMKLRQRVCIIKLSKT